MIEWMSSKVAVAVAVLVLTASVLGYFAYQRSASYEDEVVRVAESVARWVEAVSISTGEVRSTVTLGDGGNLELPASINGEPVSVNVSRNSVIVTCGKYVVSEEYVAPVHLWAPQNLSMNISAIALLDLQHSWTGNVASPGSFVLERREIRVSGEDMLFTFCYVDSA